MENANTKKEEWLLMLHNIIEGIVAVVIIIKDYRFSESKIVTSPDYIFPY